MVNKLINKILCTAAVTTVIFSSNVQAYAATTNNTLDLQKTEKKQKDLNKKISKILVNDYHNVRVDNVTIKLDPTYIQDNNIDVNSNAFEQEVLNEVKDYKNQFETSLESHKFYQAVQKTVSTNNVLFADSYSSERTASVWAGIPAIGWAYVNQDYTADIDDGFKSINFLGDSYKTGLSLGSWTHIRSWYSIPSINTHVDIYIKGVMDYSIKSGILSSQETYLYTDSDY